MKRVIISVIIVILIAILGRYFVSIYNSYSKNKAAKNRPIPDVVVDTVKNDSVIQTFDAPGRVASKYQVSIIARISGYLMKTYFKEGDYVKAGDTLFLIEPMEYQNATNSAGANIQNIKAQLAYAEKQLIRAEELVKNDYISKSRYDEILANRNSLKAQLDSAESVYDDSKRNLNYTKVKAPVDGRIGFVDVSVGNYVSPSSGSLTTINSTNPIYVKFPLASENYSLITSIDKNSKDKRKVELYFQNGTKYEYEGIQDFYDNKIDQTTGSVTLRATFPNPENQLLHGEFVNVKLYANNKITVPVVPVSAVQENQEGKYLYIVNSQGLPELKYIKVQGQSGDNWLIKDGVKAGDKIITEGILNVIPQQPIHIVTKNQN